MKKQRNQLAAPIALVGLLCLGAGAGVAAIIAQGTTPAVLSQPSISPGFVEPDTVPFDDARMVELVPTFGTATEVRATNPGTITSTTCAPGQVVSSGSSLATVDGQPLIGLATSLPAWRPLSVGARGPDVTAITTELERLGRISKASSTMRTSDLTALIKLAGLPAETVSIPPGTFVWLPSPTSTWGECEDAVGKPTSAASLGKLSPVLQDVHLKTSPVDPVEGARTLIVGSVGAPIENGRVNDPNVLTQIAATEEFAAFQRSNAQVPIPASWQLATPIPAARVPAASITTRGGRSCLAVDGRPVTVSVVSSALGKALVASSTPLTRVDYPAPEGLTCPLP